jgi:hypothetical protein
VSPRNIQRIQRARVGHQVLYLSGAPHGVQSSLTVDTVAGTQAPVGVVQSVGLQNRRQCERLVVGFGFVEVLEQFDPAALARAVRADFVQGGVDHHLITS